MTDAKDEWKLQEILHQPVTFTADCLHRDTKDLNEAISKGYTINEIVKTETGIVYVLIKWIKQIPSTTKSRKQLEKQNYSWSTFVGGNHG